MEDSYLTIEEPSEGFYKEKGSKFIAHAFYCTDEEQVKGRLEELRKQYYDARHHCYAYIMGRDGEAYRANDDGEPNNSAGQPILGQIRSKELTDVLVVVIRYFGGTKLGVSGLIQAYKTATAEALDKATIVERYYTKEVAVHFEYPEMNIVMRTVKDYELPVLEQDFQISCIVRVTVRESLLDKVVGAFEDAGKVEVS